MAQPSVAVGTGRYPSWPAVVELLKPITWFPPMWAFACGWVSAGGFASLDRWPFVLAGIVLAGPLVCGTSQAVNDWFDRHVDAINEPRRPIPSGRVPGQWGLWIALTWTALSILLATTLGPWVLAAAIVGLILAWAYSAPPVRLKQSGWWGPGTVGLCYESLPWFTAAAVVSGGLPATPILLVALLYGVGAHGIMTLNDFKAVRGDRHMGIRSLPVQLGERTAARLACAVMAVPQVLVVVLLVNWQRPVHAALVALLLAAQFAAMVRLLRDPAAHAPWYNGTGVTLYVLGMMVTAAAIGIGGVA